MEGRDPRSGRRPRARLLGGELATRLSFEVTARFGLVTSISELTTNILEHAGTGMLVLRSVSREDGVPGVEVMATEEGPGIADLERALADGYSTRGTMGGGLSGVRRLMTETVVSSGHASGTRVRAVKWADDVGRVR